MEAITTMQNESDGSQIAEQKNANEPEKPEEKPVCVTFADVSAAPFRIRDGVPQTPCEVRHSVYENNQKSIIIILT